jgi:hypothetical protein
LLALKRTMWSTPHSRATSAVRSARKCSEGREQELFLVEARNLDDQLHRRVGARGRDKSLGPTARKRPPHLLAGLQPVKGGAANASDETEARAPRDFARVACVLTVGAT